MPTHYYADAARDALRLPADFRRWLTGSVPDVTFDSGAPTGCALYWYLTDAIGLPIFAVWYGRIEIDEGRRIEKVRLDGDLAWAADFQRRLDRADPVGVPTMLAVLAEVEA